MPSARLAHGFVFVKDLDRMVLFYEHALGMYAHPSSDAGFVKMASPAGGAKVALHALPTAIAAQIDIADPPRIRSDTAYKLSFETDDFDGIRAAILANGGQAEAPWSWEGRQYCECADPEGNVIQIVESSRGVVDNE